jgi:electron transfer flavoprotein alpha subunit
MSQDIYVVIEHLQGNVSDISYVMLAAGRVLSQWTGGNLVAVLLGHNAKESTSNLNADTVHYFDHSTLKEFTSDAFLNVLSPYIKENLPRAVLLGHTSIGMDIAGGLSVRSDLPLVSQCHSFSTDGKFISQICGGKIMVEGELPEPSTIVTMLPGGYKPEEGQSDQAPEVIEASVPALEEGRVLLREYIEPEAGDVDISKAEVLIALGRGLQNEGDLELAEELAEALGGAVCASRPIVDQGWLSKSRLVGKSGKSVKPTLYFALGISGAPEHVEALLDSELIIAVNTDPNAPIYNVAKYGAEVDLIDFLMALTPLVQSN